MVPYHIVVAVDVDPHAFHFGSETRRRHPVKSRREAEDAIESAEVYGKLVRLNLT